MRFSMTMTLFYLSVLFVSSRFCGAASPGQGAFVEPSRSGRAPLVDLLEPYGDQLSLYFTLEYEGAKRDELPYRTVGPPEAVKNTQELLDLLRKWLPDADVFIDGAATDVVHIREKDLEKINGYVLDGKVSIKYKGTVVGLVSQLVSQSSGNLAIDTSQPQGQPKYDPAVPAGVDVRDASLRDLLSTALPHWTNRLLWTCVVLGRDGHSVAYLKAFRSAPPPARATASSPASAPSR